MALLAILVAGCTSSANLPNETDSPPLIAALPGVGEVGPPVTVSPAAPGVNSGEPVVAQAPDGTMYLTFTGCDRLPTGSGEGSIDGIGCFHSPLFRSDDGVTWVSLRTEGRLSETAPHSRGDTVVRVGQNGTVYLLYMDPAGITLLRSVDRGDTWDVMPRPYEGTRDRPWLDVHGDRELHLLYRVGVVIWATVSIDGGETWNHRAKVVDTHTDMSEIRYVEGCGSYVAFSVAHRSDRPTSTGLGDAFTMHLAHNAGDGWSAEELPGDVLNAPVGTHLGMPMGFPSVDVGADCIPHIVWAQETRPDGVTEGGLVIHAWNDGMWQAEAVPLGDDAVMPWIRVDDGSAYVVAYARDRIGAVDLPWDVRLARGPTWDVEVIDEGVHVGDFCTSNPYCVPTDRSLLDHLYLDLDAHGLIVAYGVEPTAPDVKQMRVALAPRG